MLVSNPISDGTVPWNWLFERELEKGKDQPIRRDSKPEGRKEGRLTGLEVQRGLQSQWEEFLQVRDFEAP